MKSYRAAGAFTNEREMHTTGKIYVQKYIYMNMVIGRSASAKTLWTSLYIAYIETSRALGDFPYCF